MTNFTRLMLATSLGAFVGLPIVATHYGIGVPSEKNPKVIKAIQSQPTSCPPGYQRADGTCSHTHRSHYRRSYFGGGTGGGK